MGTLPFALRGGRSSPKLANLQHIFPLPVYLFPGQQHCNRIVDVLMRFNHWLAPVSLMETYNFSWTLTGKSSPDFNFPSNFMLFEAAQQIVGVKLVHSWCCEVPAHCLQWDIRFIPWCLAFVASPAACAADQLAMIQLCLGFPSR